MKTEQRPVENATASRRSFLIRALPWMLLVLGVSLGTTWYWLDSVLLRSHNLIFTPSAGSAPPQPESGERPTMGTPPAPPPESRAASASASASASVSAETERISIANIPNEVKVKSRVGGQRREVTVDTGATQNSGLTVFPGSKDRAPESVLWNYWVSKSASGFPTLEPLNESTTYKAVFQLSLMDIASRVRGVSRVSATQTLQNAVAQAVATNELETLLLDVLVNPISRTSVFIPEASRKFQVEIDLAKYRDFKNLATSGTLPTEQLISAARLGQFAFDFQMRAPGKQQVGIVVLDHRTGVPVQTLTAEFTTSEPWPKSLVARGTDGAISFAKGESADLTLVFQELKTSDNYAKLNATLTYRQSVQGTEPNYGHVTWETEFSSLADLRRTIATFFTNQSAITVNEDLQEISNELGNAIFWPLPNIGISGAAESEQNQRNAQEARRIVETFSDWQAGNKPPTLLVWLRQESTAQPRGKFETEAIPISAVAVRRSQDSAPPIVFGDRFVLSLLLPAQENFSSGSCPENWYMAMPRVDKTLDDALIAAIQTMGNAIADRLRSSDIKEQSANLSELKNWMGIENDATPYVFSFLGHNGRGGLALSPVLNSPGVGAGTIRRNFVGTSIALLNACSSVSDDGTTGTTIGKLASRGVTATVATTSTVSGELAGAYLDCFTSVLGGSTDLSIGEAHLYTTQCLRGTAANRPQQKKYNYKGGALKYMLVGNPYQKICDPKKQR